MGVGDLLQLSGNAMLAYQSQVGVYGQNIANVETDGYSRRELDVEVAVDGRGQGIGVQTGDVTRCFNAMSSSALLSEESTLSFHSETASLLEQLEVLTGGSTNGFSNALKELDQAWSDVAANPEDIAARTLLIQKGASMATEFNQLSSRYTDFSESLVSTSASDSGEISGTVASINSLTTRLQDLNQTIYNADFAGRGVPSLRDDRDRLIRELSQQVNIDVSPNYRVTLGNQELIAADGSARQELEQTSAGVFSVGTTDISSQITGGELAAQVGAYTSVQNLQSNLDLLAQTLSTKINTLFESGYNLQGESPSDQGYTFFTGTDASDLALDVALFDPANPMSANPKLIAAASTRRSAGPPPIANTGDNTIARDICSLFDDPQAALGDLAPSDYWSDVETLLAGSIAEANDMAETSSKLVDLLDERIQSQSGVNLDEELINLMSSQRAYEACARVFSTANKLLDTLMNM